MYGLVGVVYGHGPPLVPPVPDKLDPIEPGNIVVPILAADDAELKQFIEFWWWFVVTTEPSGFTGHGNVFVPALMREQTRNVERLVWLLKWIYFDLDTHLMEMALWPPSYYNANMMNKAHQYQGMAEQIVFQIHSWNQRQLPRHSSGFFLSYAT
jgi:hypothetical protein